MYMYVYMQMLMDMAMHMHMDVSMYHKFGIGIGSPSVGYEGFAQPRKGQGEAKRNYYYNDFVGYSHRKKNIYIYTYTYR